MRGITKSGGHCLWMRTPASLSLRYTVHQTTHFILRLKQIVPQGTEEFEQVYQKNKVQYSTLVCTVQYLTSFAVGLLTGLPEL